MYTESNLYFNGINQLIIINLIAVQQKVHYLCRTKKTKNETKYKLLFMTIYENIKKLESVGQLSANSLVNADCLEAMKYIADKSIDCIIADLPYG